MKKCVALLLAFIFLPVFSGCDRTKRFSAELTDYFDTVIFLTAYCSSQNEFDRFRSTAEKEIAAYNRLFDIYREYDGITNLATVNRLAGNEPVTAEAPIIELLSLCKRYAVLTKGKMNPAMGTVLSLWKQCRDEGVLPQREVLIQASGHCDPENIVTDADAKTVFFADPLLRLDVGAVAKGYTAEKVAEVLRTQGYGSFLLNLGGNVYAEGTKNGEAWVAGIRDPGGEGILRTVPLPSGMSLVTSGSYQRFVEIDGVRYHHLIDPATLAPAVYFDSVTVLSSDGALADALSTALFCMSRQEGEELVRDMQNVQVLWHSPGEECITTAGFPQ